MMRWLDFLHFVDSSFPMGAYTHSFGLETLGPEHLEARLASRLREGLGRFEMVFVRHAYDRPLVALDERMESMLIPRESRRASASIGTALLTGACDLLADVHLEQFMKDGPHHHYPIVFGALAAALDVPTSMALETYAFLGLRSHVSAAQRLGWLGQRDAQRLLHRFKPEVRDAVQRASAMDLDHAGACAPAWDIAAMAHEFAPARMFAS